MGLRSVRSVQRLEQPRGFRPRLVDSRSRRDYLRFLAVPKIHGTEQQPDAPWEDLMRRVGHVAEEE